MYTSIRIVNLYPMGKEKKKKSLSTGEQCLFAVSFALRTDYVFPKLLRSAPFPSLPSVGLFHTFVTQLDSLVTVWIPFWSVLHDFFFNLKHIKVCCLCCEVYKFWQIHKANCNYIHYYSSIQNNSTTLNILCASSPCFPLFCP